MPSVSSALSGSPSSPGVLPTVEPGLGSRTGWEEGGQWCRNGPRGLLPTHRHVAPMRRSASWPRGWGPQQDEGSGPRLTLQGTREACGGSRGWESAWKHTGVTQSPPSLCRGRLWHGGLCPCLTSSLCLHGQQAGRSRCVGFSSAPHQLCIRSFRPPCLLADLFLCGRLGSACWPPPAPRHWPCTHVPVHSWEQSGGGGPSGLGPSGVALA